MPGEIQYIDHSFINKARWNSLIAASANGLAYAHCDFLDAMSPGWDALVLGDYEAAMPLTWRKKLGIRYLCQPAFSQQLGIFSATSIEAPLAEAFLRKASLHFRLIEIFLNYANRIEQPTLEANNFILSLTGDYETIRSTYRTDLLKNLARTQKFNLTYRTGENVELAIDTFQSLYGSNMKLRQMDYDALKEVSKKWLITGKCFTREVHLNEDSPNRDSLLAVGLFLMDEKRIYNIASSTLPNGRTLEANHFLFDQLIREFSGKNLMLDFEGSDLPGVARFYQKFGPINQPYYYWKSNRLPAVLRWWKR